ncbi:other/FunK1 protein kinase [Coprinopsis cinerea AmutBmut pab1-1]|nr:other/FunK1 protein kinase [Coprinopsis cinerea AmutBmut pab1-1]
MTIDGDQVRIWYHCRTHSAVSQPFSFVEEPKKLVKSLLSFLFSKEEELGYDPLVYRVGEDYIYELDDNGTRRFFRTWGPSLTDRRSNRISGRMTRVWKVVEVDSTSSDATVLGEPAILKDVWIDQSAMTEREVQEALFKDIEDYWGNVNVGTEPRLKKVRRAARKLQDQVRSGEYKKWFLTILLDYEGRRSRPLPKSARQRSGLLLGQQVLPPGSLTVETRPLSRREPNSNLPHLFSPKKQYRSLVEEVCIPVGDIERLDQVFHVLDGVIRPLLLMFGARWVHRDISAGNVLGHPQTTPGGEPYYQAKLGDLEYARRYPPSSDYTAATDPKTGTPFFMACEILLGVPFAPPLVETALEETSSEETSSDDETSEFTIRYAPTHDQRQRTRRPVIPNILHDLESIWWIATWTVLTRTSHPPSIELSRRIFVNTVQVYANSPRIEFFEERRLIAHVLPELTEVAAGLESAGGHQLALFVRHTDSLDSAAVDLLHSRGFKLFLAFFRAVSSRVPAFALTARSNKALVRTGVSQRKRPRLKDDDNYRPGAGDSNAPSDSGKGAKRSKTRNHKSGSGSK